MKTPEEIKKVLHACDEGYACKRIKCPYDDGKSLCNGSRCMTDARKDFLAYIQQLESKLAEYEKPLVPMTLDSIATNMRFLLPCWIETKANMWPDVLDRDSVGNYGKIDTRKRVAVRYLMDADYGKTWRCWSRRPTDKERKAAKWDD